VAKQLFARGSDGLVSIHDEGANYTSPLTNLDKIYFHSSLDYLRVAYMVDVNLSISAYSVDAFADTVGYATVVSHGLGYAPMMFGVRTDNKQPVTGSTVIWSSGNASVVTMQMAVDSTYIYLRVYATLRQYASPAMTIPVRIWLFSEVSV